MHPPTRLALLHRVQARKKRRSVRTLRGAASTASGLADLVSLAHKKRPRRSLGFRGRFYIVVTPGWLVTPSSLLTVRRYKIPHKAWR